LECGSALTILHQDANPMGSIYIRRNLPGNHSCGRVDGHPGWSSLQQEFQAVLVIIDGLNTIHKNPFIELARRMGRNFRSVVSQGNRLRQFRFSGPASIARYHFYRNRITPAKGPGVKGRSISSHYERAISPPSIRIVNRIPVGINALDQGVHIASVRSSRLDQNLYHFRRSIPHDHRFGLVGSPWCLTVQGNDLHFNFVAELEQCGRKRRMSFPIDAMPVYKPLMAKCQRITACIIGLYLNRDRAAQDKGGGKNHGLSNDWWTISTLKNTGAWRNSRLGGFRITAGQKDHKKNAGPS
jgi:hypothetical protein